VNVRGRAGLVGEIIARLTNGEPVMVIEEVRLRNSRPDEPSAWARIALPETAKVWVHASFIDATNMTVIPRRLNLRGGPGENYSVLGTLERGAAVAELQRQGEWIEIRPPDTAYAFVAAPYLKQESLVAAHAAPDAVQPEPEPAPVETTPVAEAPALAGTVTETPSDPGVGVLEQPVTPEMPVEEVEPPQPRIVEREGIVRGVASIQAPTRYELMSPDTHRTINYLYTSAPGLDLSRYKGLRIIVTGEESLDERWRNTPIITIQRIQVLE
jgi:SH3-like domain-containing protein